MLERFLVALAMAILEKLLAKGTESYSRYRELQRELERNAEAAGKYQEVVDRDTAGREARRKAEDELLS